MLSEHLFYVQEHDKQYSVLFKDVYIVKNVLRRLGNGELQG